MDYILFGAGTGASLAVIGWILREWGPRLRDGKSDDDVIYSASELIDRMSWARFCASCGMAIVVAGTLILLATAVVTAWNPGDALAARILVGMYVLVSLLMLVWAFLYTRQFGTSGIYRPAPVNPVSETREAVVVEREIPVSPEDLPPDGDTGETANAEPPAEPEPDFAEVAARRGGLGRFASFFNRQRPAEIAVENRVVDREDEQDDTEAAQPGADEPDRTNISEVDVVVETDQPGENGQQGADLHEVAAIAGADEGSVEVIDAVDVAEIEPSPVEVPETMDGEADPADTGEVAESMELPVDQNTDETSTDAAIEETAPVATPEDDALSELRRRRLARLSGENH